MGRGALAVGFGVGILVTCCMLIASGAQAAEYKVCVHVKRGGYDQSQCNVGYLENRRHGHYELEALTPCFKRKHGFYANSQCSGGRVEKRGKGKGMWEKLPPLKLKGGPAKITAQGLGSGAVECTSSSGEGEFTGARTTAETLRYSGCTFEGLPCESDGPVRHGVG